VTGVAETVGSDASERAGDRAGDRGGDRRDGSRGGDGVASDEGGRVDGLTEIIDRLDERIAGEETLSVADVLDAFGSRSFGPLLTAPALVLVSPIGGIPGVPTALAACIVVIAVQHVFGSRPWLPRLAREREVERGAWDRARDRLRPWARRVDGLIEPRWTWLTSPPASRVIAAIVCVAALAAPPLELLPFAAAVPGAAVLMLSLSLTARDGLLACVGGLATIATVWLSVAALTG